MRYLEQFSKNATDNVVRVIWQLQGTIDNEAIVQIREARLNDDELTAAAVAKGKTTWDEAELCEALKLDGNLPSGE